MEKIKKNPTSVRFDKEKMDFIKEKENLSTVQKVFTFLLDKYWWERQVGINPVLERQDELTKWAKSTELGKISQKVSNESMSTFKVRNFSSNDPVNCIYTDTAGKILEYEAEMSTLQLGSFGNQRKKFLQQRISELKKQIKP